MVALLKKGKCFDDGCRVCFQVGVKGNTQVFNRGLDCDVIVAEVKYCFYVWTLIICQTVSV